MRRFLVTGLLVFQVASCTGAPPSDVTTEPEPVRGLMLSQQSSGTDALLQAVSPVNDDVVWVSGHEATYARTSDGLSLIHI